MRYLLLILILAISTTFGGLMLEVFLEQYALSNGLAYKPQLGFSLLASAIIHGVGGACYMLWREELHFREKVRDHE